MTTDRTSSWQQQQQRDKRCDSDCVGLEVWNCLRVRTRDALQCPFHKPGCCTHPCCMAPCLLAAGAAGASRCVSSYHVLPLHHCSASAERNLVPRY